MTSLPPKIFAYNTFFKALHILTENDDVQKVCPGMDIVEGDWLFFDPSGSSLEAKFSVQAKMNFETNSYTHGVYSLVPGHGDSLRSILHDVIEVIGSDSLKTSSEVEAFLNRK